MKRFFCFLSLVGFIFAAMMTASCEKQLQPTTLLVKDSVRHYYPIVMGDELAIRCELTNDGLEPLAITDIQPSNFSITLESPAPDLIPPGKTETIFFTFHSDKNVGFTEHEIRFFGNIKPEGYATLTFDTHIVRPTLERSDYEEQYFDNKQNALEETVDGTRGQKGYWIDGSDEDSIYQRSYKKYLIN